MNQKCYKQNLKYTLGVFTFIFTLSIFVWSCHESKIVDETSNDIHSKLPKLSSYFKFNDFDIYHLNASIKTISTDGKMQSDIEQLQMEIPNEDMKKLLSLISEELSGDILQEKQTPESLIFYFGYGKVENPKLENIVTT